MDIPTTLSVTLTTKQHAIIKLMIKGMTNEEIGLQLKVAAKTVKFHRTNIYKAYNVKNISEFMKIVYSKDYNYTLSSMTRAQDEMRNRLEKEIETLKRELTQAKERCSLLSAKINSNNSLLPGLIYNDDGNLETRSKHG